MNNINTDLFDTICKYVSFRTLCKLSCTCVDLYNKIRTNDNRYILRTTYPTFKDFATLKKNEFKTILKHNIGENQILNKLSWLIDKHPSNYKKTKRIFK